MPAQYSTATKSLTAIKKKTNNSGTKATNVPDKVLAGKHNTNPVNILVYLQLLCAQRSKELRFNWQVEISSKQLTAHS